MALLALSNHVVLAVALAVDDDAVRRDLHWIVQGFASSLRRVLLLGALDGLRCAVKLAVSHDGRVLSKLDARLPLRRVIRDGNAVRRGNGFEVDAWRGELGNGGNLRVCASLLRRLHGGLGGLLGGSHV